MGHWPKLHWLFLTLIVCSSGSIMFGLVGKYIGNKETKGRHKRWLKLQLKDRGGGALSYGCFSDCIIVSLTELLVHLVQWLLQSGKHFSTCEESLIPGGGDGFTICVCGPRKSQPLGTSRSHRTLTQMLQHLFKSLHVCSSYKAHISGLTSWISLHVWHIFKEMLMMHKE